MSAMSKATRQVRTPAELRDARGWSLQEAAVRAGVSSAALARIESGGVGVTMTTVDRVATLYGVKASELVAGCERVREGAAA